MQEYIQRLCNKNWQNQVVCESGGKTVSENWWSLKMARADKQRKKKTSILFEREPKAEQNEPSTIWHAIDPTISPNLGLK